MAWIINYYTCPKSGHTWCNEWQVVEDGHAPT